MQVLTQQEREQRCQALLDRLAKEEQEKAAHKNKLAKEHDLTNNPKLDLLYQKAWEHGHANGFSEVEFWFDDLAELL